MPRSPRPSHDVRRLANLRSESNLSGDLAVSASTSRLDFRGNALLIARVLIVVMALWLPVHTMAAVGMAFCQQMPQGDASIDTQTVDVPSCDQTNPGILQGCRLCHSCVVCPMPTLSADCANLFLLPPFSFEPVAVWQSYGRCLDVIEHPPRPFLPLAVSS